METVKIRQDLLDEELTIPAMNIHTGEEIYLSSPEPYYCFGLGDNETGDILVSPDNKVWFIADNIDFE